MKIRFKLLSGFLGVAVLCGAVGVIGIVVIGRMGSSINALTGKTIPKIIALNEITKNFLAIKVVTRNLANPEALRSRSFISEQIANVDKARSIYRPIYDEYSSSDKTDEEERLWENVKNDLSLAAAYTNKTIELAKGIPDIAESTARASQYALVNDHVWGSDRNSFDSLISNIEKLIEYMDDFYGKKEAERLAAESLRSSVMLVTTTIVAFLLSIFLGIGIGSAIGTTLKKTVDTIGKLSDGDVTARLKVTTKDEFAVVANSIEKLSGTVSGLIDEAARLTNASTEGRLSVRGDADRFKGGFADVIHGINRIVNALVGFLDNMPAPAMIIDREFNILYMNRAGAGLGGTTGQQLVDARRKCFDFFKTGDCRTPNCACSRAIQSGAGASSETQATPISDAYDIAYSGIPVRNVSGDIVGAFEVISDQTTIKRAERKMRKISDYQGTEIERLNKNLEKIAVGNLDCDFAVSKSDEDTGETAELFSRIARSLETSVKAIESLAADANMLTEAAVAGALQTRADASLHKGDYRKIIDGVNKTLDLVIEPINETISVFKRLADGDLTARMDGDYAGDFDVLKTSLNQSLDSINETLVQINTAVDQVAEGSLQVSQASQALSQGATEQAASLEEITSSTTEIASQTKQNTENAVKMNNLAREAQENAEKGNAQMKDLVSAMNGINSSAEEIKKVVKTIDDISFQINLLALNANVEAARAGKYGKGFAVVAEEVRNLAVRSANSVKETTRMVEEAIQSIQRGNLLVDGTAKQLDEIVGGSAQVSTLAEEVATAGREQTQGLDQISLGLNQIDQVTQSNTASAEQSASASEELSSQSQEVKAMLAKFTLKAPNSRLNNADVIAMLRAELAGRNGGAKTAQAAPGIARAQSTPAIPTAPRAKTAEAREQKGTEARRKPIRPSDVISLDDANFGKF